jgi:hypothetical protein
MIRPFSITTSSNPPPNASQIESDAELKLTYTDCSEESSAQGSLTQAVDPLTRIWMSVPAIAKGLHDSLLPHAAIVSILGAVISNDPESGGKSEYQSLPLTTKRSYSPATASKLTGDSLDESASWHGD